MNDPGSLLIVFYKCTTYPPGVPEVLQRIRQQGQKNAKVQQQGMVLPSLSEKVIDRSRQPISDDR